MFWAASSSFEGDCFSDRFSLRAAYESLVFRSWKYNSHPNRKRGFRKSPIIGTPAEQLVKQAALRLVEEDEQFHADIDEAIQQADHGQLIDHEEVKPGSSQPHRRPYSCSDLNVTRAILIKDRLHVHFQRRVCHSENPVSPFAESFRFGESISAL